MVITVVTSAPIFATLYLLTASTGNVGYVAVLQAIVTLCLVVGIGAGGFAAIIITSAEIKERGYFGITHSVPIEEIASMVLIRVSDVGTGEFRKHAFVLDANGKVLLRMRGKFWDRETVNQFAQSLDVPVTLIEHPLTPLELRKEHGALLYRYERHPHLTTTGAVLGGTIIAAPLFALAESWI